MFPGGGGIKRERLKRATTTIVGAIVVALLAIMPAAPSAWAAESTGLDYVGTIHGLSPMARMIADENGSRLVAFENPESDPFALQLRVFDDAFVPLQKKLLPEAVLTTPPVHAWDAAHRTLYLVTFASYVDSIAWRAPSLVVVDIATLAVRKLALSLDAFPPGLRVLGMSFATDRLYVVGSIASGNELEPGTRSVVVAELDPATAKPTWPAPGFIAVPRCQGVFASSQQAAVTLDPKLRSLFVGCRATTFALVGSPGSPAVVRVGIADPTHPEFELYPVSGSYATGLALADETVRRLVMISSTGTNEAAYVFDQAAGRYLGVVSIAGQFRAAGMNGKLGHVYVMTSDRLLVSSYTGVKIPQAIGFSIGQGVLRTQVMVSPRRNLIAVPVRAGDSSDTTYKIYRDTLPRFVEPESSPDASTNDVAEKQGVTETLFSGEGRAFGFRVKGVGGFNGLVQNVLPNANADYWRSLSSPAALMLGLMQRGDGCSNAAELCELIAKPGNLSDGDRDLHAAYVSEARLSSDDALVSAETVTVDHGTRSDYGTILEDQAWPYTPARCIDQGSGPAAKPGDEATASCSLSKGLVDAHTTFTRGSVAGPVSFAWSQSSVRIERTAALGVHVTSFAETRDVRIGDDVFVGRVASLAETAARGRPGTSAARHRVWFENVQTPVYACADDCDVRTVLTSIARSLDEGIEIEMPVADIVATPRGAQGSVLRRVVDQQQDVVFNNQSETGREVPALRVAVVLDNTERSRVVYDFAAAQAVSTYTISALPVTPDDAAPVVLPPLPDTLPGVGPLPPTTLRREGGGLRERVVAVPGRPWRLALAWSPRSALAAATWTFFAVPLLLAYRRRSIAALRRSTR